MSASSSAVIDPALAAPELTALRTAVLNRDWAGVTACFERLTDHNDHEYAVYVVGDVAGSEEFLREQSSSLGRTLYARRLIITGWEIRSGARAQYVSREQFAGFHDHLRQAERILVELTAEDPANSSAWVSRLHTARGLELGQNEARRRYDTLSRHVPHFYMAQAAMVQQLCPKWSGSFDKLHRFASESMRAAPPGSLSPLAVVEAHIEHWQDIEDDRSAAAYLADPVVRTEIREAARQSVDHPGFRPGFRWVTAHNHFAFIYSLLGDHAAAAPHFRKLGNLAAELYWAYLGDPVEQFMAHRAKALGKDIRG